MSSSAQTLGPEAKPTTPGSTSSAYRLDLDGLRGIAIALVAIFHVWFGRVSGGVDVFLTLSGYFFVASLLKHVLATQTPAASWRMAINPGPRLWRLARRLLPALLLVLIVIVALIAVVMPKTRWGSLASEVIASAFYYQNYELAFASQDYQAAGSANSPMQHLWSMSMQGQFFVLTLVCGLALGGVLKFLASRYPYFANPTVVRNIVGGSLALVALVSFAWANYRHAVNQPFNYYDTVARLWEPLAGGLLALWMPRFAIPRWLRNGLALLALVLITGSGWIIQGVLEYPGILALVPVGSTLLLIWTGSPEAKRTRPDDESGMPRDVDAWLSHPSIVWLGSVAYALYLIHWPLLIFYLTWRYQDETSFVEGTAILAVSLLLAWATTKFVEIPLRAGRSTFSRTYRVTLVVLLSVATVVAGTTVAIWKYNSDHATINTANLDPRLYPGARALLYGTPVPHLDPQPSPEVVDKDWPITSYDSTIAGWRDESIKVGVYGDRAAKRTVALVGGSHAEQWITALDAIGKQRHFRVTTYLKVGCALTTSHVFIWFGKKYYQCNDWSRRVMDRLAADKPDFVFTNSTRPVEGQGKGDFVPQDYLDIFAQFRDRGQKVIAIRDNPWSTGKLQPPECLAEGKKPQVCGVSRAQGLAPVDPSKAIASKFPNMSFLDYSDGMCSPTYCSAVVGNILLWHDFHHLSATFVRSLTPTMDRDLGKVVGWW